MADIAGDHWPETARAACLALTQQAAEQDEDEGDIGVRMLWAAVASFRELHLTAITPEALQEHLVKDPTAPWADYRAGHAISTRAIAVLLRRFGIKAHKSGSKRTYELKDFAAPLESYPEAIVARSEEVSQASEVSQVSRSGTLRTDETLGTLVPTGSEIVVNDDGYWGSLLADETAVDAEQLFE